VLASHRWQQPSGFETGPRCCGCDAAQQCRRVRRVMGGDQVATCAVFNSKKEMLWGKRRDSGKYTTPGGHMLPSESPTEGAKRELKEEAGIEVEHLDYIGVVEVGDIFVHVVKVDDCDQVPNSDGDPDAEVEAWEWIPLTDGALPAHVMSSLHSPRNAHVELGLCRAVMGGEDVAAVLNDAVITDAMTQPGAEFVSGVTALGFDAEGDSDGLVVKSTPVVSRGVVPHKKFPLVEGAWDADAAVARWRSYSTKPDGSIDWSKFAECFAWFDSDKPDAMGSYKLPHHDIRDGKPVTVWGGVVAAAAAIQGARGGVKGIPAADVAKIEQHLGEHYREFDKVPPWDKERAAVYAPEPIVPAVATIADGPLFPLAGAVPPVVQALVFSVSRFSEGTVQTWCGDNGFAMSTDVRVVNANASHCGINITQNSLLVEQLPEACFTGGFVTFVLEEGVLAICGTLNEWGQNSLRRAADDIDFAASKGAIAELRMGIDWHEKGLSGDGLEPMTVREAKRIVSTGKWWPEKVKRAYAFFARHDEQAGPLRDDKGKPTPKAVARALWGGDAGKKDATRLRNAMLAAEKRSVFAAAWTTEQSPSFAALIATSQRSHNSAYYLVRSDNYTAVQPTKRSVAATTETKPMKRPESRAAYRALIHHALEGAEMHTRALEDGHIAEEHRSVHHAMAMRALDHADEMNSICRAAFIGDTASQDVVVDGAIESGEIYNVPESRNVELKTRFAEVATKVGRLPRSLRSIVSAELGTVDGEIVEEKLMGFKADRGSLIELRRASVESSKKVDRVETEQAIEKALDEKCISPADAKRMRGLDPATGVVRGEPWSRARVERFVSERREVGPIAEVVRPGVERTVQSQVERTVAASSSAVPIRYGHAQQQLSQQDATILARKISQQLGLKEGELDNHMAAAAALPATDVKSALANSKAM